MAENKLSFYIPETVRWKGWRKEEMPDLMRRLYINGFEDKKLLQEAIDWQQMILYGLSGAVRPIHLDNQPIGIRPIAVMDGAMGRRFIDESPSVLEVPKKLKESYANSTLPEDSFYRDILVELPEMPFNTDIKVVCDDVRERAPLFEAIGDRIQQFIGDASFDESKTEDGFIWTYSPSKTNKSMAAKVQYITHGNNVKVAKYSLLVEAGTNRNTKEKIYKTVYTTDITFFPTQEELEHDLRRGPHLSSKQQPYSYLGAKKVNSGNDVDEFYCFASDDDVKRNQHVLQEPTVIEKPKYDSLEAALIAGLQAIRLEGMWPALDPKFRYDHETVIRYKEELSKAYRKFLQVGEEPNEYRVKEIIRNAVVCATDNYLHFFESALRLGILDVFFPKLQDLLICTDEFKRSERAAIFSHILYGSLESLESFCEAFDIRRLQK